MTTTTADASSRVHRATGPGGVAAANAAAPAPQVAAPPIVRTGPDRAHLCEQVFVAALLDMQALRDQMRAGIDIDATDAQGDTALSRAARSGNLQAAIHLKRNGAWIDCRNLDGETPLMLAARNGHLPLFKKLLKTWGANAALTDKSGCTPLHHAAYGGNADIVRMLIAAGGNVDPVAVNGYTPLLKAVLGDRCETARILLQAGCDLHARDAFVDFLAIGFGNLDMLEVLGQYGKWKEWLAQRRDYHADLCALAVKHEHPYVVRWLVSAGVSFTPLPDMLFLAVEKNGVDMVRLLLEHGLPPDNVDTQGHTALWKAVEAGNTPIVDSLLRKGADMFSKSHPELLLFRAIRTGNATLVARLLQGGQWKTSIAQPMLLAAELGHQGIVACLLDAGFVPETPDRTKSAALLATEHGHVDVVRLLHERGAGGSPDLCRRQLLQAIRKWHAPIVALLLDRDGEVDAALEKDAMSCMSLDEPRSLAIVDLLLSAKYSIQRANPAGLNRGEGSANDFHQFSLAMLKAAALSDADARESMRSLGIRSANWPALLALARTVLAISAELTVEGASRQQQQGAAFGLLLADMSAPEDGPGRHDEFHLFENARLQKQALGVAGKAHFDAVCCGCVGDLTLLSLAHSNIHLQVKGLDIALNERGALLPSLAHKVAKCCAAALSHAFETLSYQGPVAGLTTYLQARLPGLLAASLLRWFEEAVRPATGSSLQWTGDALPPQTALKHILIAQLALLRRQADAWARAPVD